MIYEIIHEVMMKKESVSWRDWKKRQEKTVQKELRKAFRIAKELFFELNVNT